MGAPILVSYSLFPVCRCWFQLGIKDSIHLVIRERSRMRYTRMRSRGLKWVKGALLFWFARGLAFAAGTPYIQGL